MDNGKYNSSKKKKNQNLFKLTLETVTVAIQNMVNLYWVDST